MSVLIDTAIDARWVIPVDTDGHRDTASVLAYHSIGIKDGTIIALLPTGSFYDTYTPATRVANNVESTCLIPGLINCHTHIAMTALRGFQDDANLDEWLESWIWPAEGKLLREHARRYITFGTTLGAREALRTGTTCINDMYFYPSICSEVLETARLRGYVGWALCGDSIADTTNLEKAKRFARQPQAEAALVRHSYALHAPYTVDLETYAKLAEDAADEDSVRHTHLHETEKELTREGRPTCFVEFEKAGFLNRRVVAAHCVHLTEEDISIVRRTNTNVCHCPKSNMKLGSGMAPVSRLLDEGVNVCLGTDSSSSNNSLDMLSEVQYAVMMAKCRASSKSTLDCYDGLRLATRNGALALGRLADLGSLEVGKAADIVAVDLEDCYPVYDPISTLVYTTQRKVTDVWVKGEHVVKGGDVVTVPPPSDEVLLQVICDLRAEIAENHTKRTSETSTSGSSVSTA